MRNRVGLGILIVMEVIAALVDKLMAAAFDLISSALPADTTIVRTSAVENHHGFFRYSWERRQGTQVAIEGVDFGWTDDSGRIRRIVTFDGRQPAPRV